MLDRSKMFDETEEVDPDTIAEEMRGKVESLKILSLEFAAELFGFHNLLVQCYGGDDEQDADA